MGTVMYSVVRENFYDSGKLSRADKEMKEFQSIHAAQPGYRGNIVVDLGTNSGFAKGADLTWP